MQIVRAALVDRLAQAIERAQRYSHCHPDNRCGTEDHQQQSQRRAQDDGAGKPTAGNGGFRHRDCKGYGVDPGGGKAAQARDPDRLAAEHAVHIARAIPLQAIHRRKVLVAGEKLAVRPIHPVKHAILCCRRQHLQRDIGNIDFKGAVLRHDDAFGNGKRRAGEHPVRDDIGGVDRLAIGVGQCHAADDRGRHQEPAEKPAPKRIGDLSHSAASASLSR